MMNGRSLPEFFEAQMLMKNLVHLDGYKKRRIRSLKKEVQFSFFSFFEWFGRRLGSFGWSLGGLGGVGVGVEIVDRGGNVIVVMRSWRSKGDEWLGGDGDGDGGGKGREVREKGDAEMGEERKRWVGDFLFYGGGGLVGERAEREERW